MEEAYKPQTRCQLSMSRNFEVFTLQSFALVSLARLLAAITFCEMGVSEMSQDNQAWIYGRVGSRVFECRKSSGMTQKELAEKVGLTRASIANIESGRQKIMLHSLYHIAEVLSVEPSELLPPPLAKPSTLKQIDMHRLLEGRSKQEQNFIRHAVEQAERRQ